MLITAFGVFFVTAVQIALPLIAVLFVADLGLALLTKVAPQLNAINVDVPGQDRADPAAARPVVPGPARGGATGSSDLATEAMAALAGAG